MKYLKPALAILVIIIIIIVLEFTLNPLHGTWIVPKEFITKAGFPPGSGVSIGAEFDGGVLYLLIDNGGKTINYEAKYKLNGCWNLQSYASGEMDCGINIQNIVKDGDDGRSALIADGEYNIK
jgi:hypothetical protein